MRTINILFSEEITTAFRRFGALVVDWPHKAESKSYFPPKGTPIKFEINRPLISKAVFVRYECQPDLICT